MSVPPPPPPPPGIPMPPMAPGIPPPPGIPMPPMAPGIPPPPGIPMPPMAPGIPSPPGIPPPPGIPLPPGIPGVPPPPGIPLPPGIPGVPPPPGIPLPPGIPGVPRPPGIPGPPLPPGVPGFPPMPPGVPGFPPMFPGMGMGKKQHPNKKPKVPMKSYNWAILKFADTKGTIFEKIDDTKFQMFEDDLIANFCKAAPKKTEKVEEKPKTKKAEKVSFAKPERQRDIGIILNKVKLKPLEISDALLGYNEDVLNDDVCDLLYPILPGKEEYDEISKATEAIENEDDFATPDLFIMLTGCIVGYKERLKSILFKNSYRKKSVDILQLIDYFFKGFEFIKTNEHLRNMLEIMLAIGNYMNGVGPKGGAFGFKFLTIKKFFEAKGKDNKTMMVDYLVKFIMDDLKKPEILDTLPFLQLFEKMSMDGIDGSYKNLLAGFKDVENLKTLTDKKKDELEEDDKTEEFFEEFYEHAKKTIKFIEDKIKNIEEEFKGIMKLFSEKDKEKFSLNMLVDTFKLISKEIFEALKKYKEIKEKEEKLRILKEKKEAKERAKKK